jgi:predicted glycoside hydrolase/deacetylase ChbG (UPF0249 family)
VSRVRLIINADDLGLAESVNRGILETMQAGVVRSASLMVNMPAHHDAIHRLESARTLLGRPLAIIPVQILRMVLSMRPAPSRATLDDVAFAGFALTASPALDSDLERLLRALPAGTTELMVHPGYDSPALAALDPYRAPRERAVRALTSPMLRDLLKNLGVALTHFGATAAPASASTPAGWAAS